MLNVDGVNMTSQAVKDKEEYQLGQQGTATGSVYNQAGLDDKYVLAQRPTKKHEWNAADSLQIPRNNPSSKNIDNSYSQLFAIVMFVSVTLYSVCRSRSK